MVTGGGDGRDSHDRRDGHEGRDGPGRVTAGAWDISVDGGLCLGSGMCAGLAPEVFALDGWHARVREVPAGPDPRVLEAAEICPAQAITVREGTAPAGPG
ncbi:ferredoxin [Streptomyces sp. CAU 1734]|uniref:ferredoxin n=1 Tax=Streptomyces sp. CAU 1734 TaxID=3140360 RepID=UPI00326053F5